jgi:hypothetical protein
MKRILSVVLIALFLGCFSTAFAQDIDLAWKARALKASENLEKINKKMVKDDSKKLRFEGMVESAYKLIVAAPEITTKKTPTIASYHLLLSYGDDGMLDVVYLYDLKTSKYFAVRIDHLPKYRSVVFSQVNKLDDLITIANNSDSKEPIVMFSKSDPFKVSVVER